jgi:hypothetical protein
MEGKQGQVRLSGEAGREGCVLVQGAGRRNTNDSSRDLYWDRQRVQKHQLFLLFPLHGRTGGGFSRKKSLWVCGWVCPVQFVFVKRKSGSNISLVRGTVERLETENSL